MHLETALRGILISERWPKSGVDVIITVLEGEEDRQDNETVTESGGDLGQSKGWGMMSLLSGCITVASAAIADAGIDCIDLVTGGVAAMGRQPEPSLQRAKSMVKTDLSDLANQIMADPCPAEHEDLQVACVVGYVQSRDELTEIWVKGKALEGNNELDSQAKLDMLLDRAIEAAVAARLVVVGAINESTKSKIHKARNDQT